MTREHASGRGSRPAAARRCGPRVAALLAAALVAGCGEPGASQARDGAAEARRGSIAVKLGTQRFELELALDPAARYRGLGGRERIGPHEGMLFAFPRARALEFVMRDCRVPLDIAFLDGRGLVLAIHTMDVEPPRRPGESAGRYEARLPSYGSVLPARFAVEVAAGRLRDAGLRVGDRVSFDHAALGARAR